MFIVKKGDRINDSQRVLRLNIKQYIKDKIANTFRRSNNKINDMACLFHFAVLFCTEFDSILFDNIERDSWELKWHINHAEQHIILYAQIDINSTCQNARCCFDHNFVFSNIAQ